MRRYFLDHLRRGDVLPDHLPTSSSNASTMAASFCMDKPRSTLDPTAYLQVRSYRVVDDRQIALGVLLVCLTGLVDCGM